MRSAGKYLALMELAWLLVVVGATVVSGSFAGAPLSALATMTASAAPWQQAVAIALVSVGFAFKAAR